MTTLLPPPTGPRSRVVAQPTNRAAGLQAVERVVDRSVHAIALLVRAAAYGASAAVIGGAAFGPSFLFGALLGDLLGSVAQLRNSLRTTPVAAAAETAMLAVFAFVGATSVGWPFDAEMRSLLLLSAFASFAARLGWAFGGRDDRVL